ncbi:TolC family protein [Flavobacterium sp. XS1P32]|uniref:TolC family protein n=1 Tax=Flavobacterium sp. XS1P32 TaxID=3401726 RepID=UPI003AB103D3
MSLIKKIVFLLVPLLSFSQQRDVHFFIEKAVLNSALLEDLNNQTSAISIDSLVYKANLKPQLNANLFTNYAPVINNFGYDTALSNGQTVSGLVSFSQKIFGKEQKNNQLRSLTLLKDKMSFNKRITINDIKKAVQLQYIVTYSDHKQLVFLQQQLDLLNNELEILKKLTQKSIYKQTDYLLFLSTVSQQDLITLQTKQQFVNDLAVLNYLCGTNERESVELLESKLELNQLITADESIFNNQYKIDSLSIQNQRKNIANTYKPSLSLLADAGYNSTLTVHPYKNFGYSFGFNFSIPFYDGHQRKLQISKNDLAQKTNIAYKSQFERQYKQQQEQLIIKINQNELLLQKLEKQLKINETLITAFTKLLVSGNAIIMDYVLALNNSITIHNTIAQNNTNRLLLINEFNYWNTNEK